jgi:phosphatidate cytidylyltransferase
MKRVLTAAALIPVIVWVVLFANAWIFRVVLAAAAVLSYYEFDGIAAAYGFGAPGPLGYGFGLLLLVSNSEAWTALAATAVVGLAVALRADEPAQALPRAALLTLGVAYVFGCWKCAGMLRAIDPRWLLFALLVNWMGDAGAYYAGVAFGRRQMAPRLSPHKSWEGAAASLVVSLLGGTAYLAYFAGVNALAAAVAACAANIAGQVGDLAESALKRGAKLKDSGSILPGHGGFLDRVDSTLFTLPAVYAWVAAFR